MRKCIVLNALDLTSKKREIFDRFFNEYRSALNSTALQIPLADSSNQLHHLTYSDIRKTSTLPSDIVQEARKDVWKSREDIMKYGSKFKRFSIRLNKRWFRYVKSKRGNLCFKITYSPRKSFTIPVCLDNQFKRLQSFIDCGWSFDNVSLLQDCRISVVLEKEFPKKEIKQRYVIGIDVGSDTLASVTIFDSIKGKSIKQLYFGRDISIKQRKFSERRARLKSLADTGSEQARKSLKKLGKKESDFVKTRSGQIAKEIVNLAIEYEAYISIEKLKNLRAKRGEMNKSARKKINIIPYGKFKQFLESNCEQLGIPLHTIDAYHTSKWCVQCGALNNGHSSNYALYRCGKCKFVGNSDRKASMAVAIKSLLERTRHTLTSNASVQISKSRVPVNGLLRPDDVGIEIAVQH